MAKDEAKDFYEAIDNLDYYFPTMLELVAKVAQYQREHYNQLIKSGFSDKQALEIVKAYKVPFG